MSLFSSPIFGRDTPVPFLRGRKAVTSRLSERLGLLFWRKGTSRPSHSIQCEYESIRSVYISSNPNTSELLRSASTLPYTNRVHSIPVEFSDLTWIFPILPEFFWFHPNFCDLTRILLIPPEFFRCDLNFSRFHPKFSDSTRIFSIPSEFYRFHSMLFDYTPIPHIPPESIRWIPEMSKIHSKSIQECGTSQVGLRGPVLPGSSAESAKKGRKGSENHLGARTCLNPRGYHVSLRRVISMLTTGAGIIIGSEKKIEILWWCFVEIKR